MPAPRVPIHVLPASIFDRNGGIIDGYAQTHWDDLGRGVCGHVYTGTLVVAGAQPTACAMKKFRNFKKFIQELDCLVRVRRVAGCIKLLGYVRVDTDSEWWALLELCDRSLEQLFKMSPSVPSIQLLECALTDIGELYKTVRNLHKEGHLHLDIKPSNVLLRFDGGYRLGDFGTLRRWQSGEVSWTQYGKAYEPAGRWSDVFSTGATVLETLSWIFWGPEGVAEFNTRRNDEQTKRDPTLTIGAFVVYYHCNDCNRDHCDVSAEVQAQLDKLRRAIFGVLLVRLGARSAAQVSKEIVAVMRGMLEVEHNAVCGVACPSAVSHLTTTRLDMETVVGRWTRALGKLRQ
jgi:serine/threonine protein kinase